MWNINKKLLPMKAHYFLFNGGVASILSFLPLYARQLGLSSIVLGTVYTILPIAGTLAKPLFGAMADHFQIQKKIFLGNLIVMTVAYFLMQFIPEASTQRSAVLTCDTMTYFKSCNQDLDTCKTYDIMAETGDNATVVFEAVCDVSSDSTLGYQICNSWNIQSFCNSTSSVLMFKSEIPIQHILYSESCIYFHVHEAVTDGTRYVPFCTNLTAANCSLSCNSSTMNQLLESPAIVSSDIIQLSQFWLFFMLLISSYTTRVVATSVGDAICFQLLGNVPQKFGQQRLWGSGGWGVASILSGVLVDCFSDETAKKNFTAMFYMMLVLMILDIVISCKLECNQEISHSIWKNVGKVMIQARINIFIVWCTFVGVANGILWLFLFWHLEDLVSSEDCQVQIWMKTLEGFIMGIRCFAGELPFFFFSGCIIKKIGHVHAMSLVLFVFSVRCILYSVLQNPWWCLPLELLQGLTFGLCYSTMSSYTNIVAPPGTKTTMQGIIGAAFEGVGVSLGSLIGGLLYDTYGGALTFQAIGVASFIAFILHMFIQHLLTYPSVTTQKQNMGQLLKILTDHDSSQHSLSV